MPTPTVKQVAYWLKSKVNAWLEQFGLEHPQLAQLDLEILVHPDETDGIKLLLVSPSSIEMFEPTWLGVAQIMECIRSIAALAEAELLDDWDRAGLPTAPESLPDVPTDPGEAR